MRKPAAIDPLADRILQELAGFREAAEVVLGGYLALQHHLDYRTTRDIHAWWRVRATPAAEKAILTVMRKVAAEKGFTVRERRFGETLSIELLSGGRKHFSFQIATRSVELQHPVDSPWPPILIETFADTAGSKMNALVDRGSPRDFLDIRAIVEHGLLKPPDCWGLWEKKNPGQSSQAARQKVLLHLAALELRRPLEAITSPEDREQARLTRAWFKREFLEI
jgi:hypothetical protein